MVDGGVNLRQALATLLTDHPEPLKPGPERQQRDQLTDAERGADPGELYEALMSPLWHLERPGHGLVTNVRDEARTGVTGRTLGIAFPLFRPPFRHHPARRNTRQAGVRTPPRAPLSWSTVSSCRRTTSCLVLESPGSRRPRSGGGRLGT